MSVFVWGWPYSSLDGDAIEGSRLLWFFSSPIKINSERNECDDRTDVFGGRDEPEEIAAEPAPVRLRDEVEMLSLLA